MTTSNAVIIDQHWHGCRYIWRSDGRRSHKRIHKKIWYDGWELCYCRRLRNGSKQFFLRRVVRTTVLNWSDRTGLERSKPFLPVLNWISDGTHHPTVFSSPRLHLLDFHGKYKICFQTEYPTWPFPKHHQDSEEK